MTVQLAIPGFVDLQVNGYLGVDFSAPDLSEETCRAACHAVLQAGAAAFLPTLVTSSLEVYARNLPILAALWLGWAFAQKRMMRWDQRAWRDKMVLKLGPAGELERQRSLLAFLRMLRRLSAAGMMPDTAWEGAMNVAPNAEVRQRLNEAYLLIRGGMPLHEAFAQTGLFADQTEQMLATGVVSGQVVDALDSICAYYQQRVEQSVGATRYLMFRIGSVLTIVLTGVLLIVMMKLYFTSVFEFADTFSAGN